MKRNLILMIAFLFVTQITVTAQGNITLEDIYASRKLVTKRVPGFNFLNDGKHYTRLEENKIVKYDITTGRESGVIFDAGEIPDNTNFNGQIDSYTFSDDESKILISSETERIYRHSTRAWYFVYDLRHKSLTPVFQEAKVRLATFSAKADKVAFVFLNNLFVNNFTTNKVTRITNDGKENEIINGASDWVYEEEFSFTKAFQWAPDGEKIAYYRFDESEVPEFTMTNYRDGVYPEYETFKYPKVGQKNSEVEIHIYNLKSSRKTKVNIPEQMEYIPRIKWTQDPDKLCVFNMNRHQNHLILYSANAKSGEVSRLLEEKNKYYIDIHDELNFLKNGTQFIWMSETDGWNHVYLYNMSGAVEKQLTKGNWEVTNFYGVDEKKGQYFYQAAKDGPLRRHIYSGNLKKGKTSKMTTQDGTNSAQFSSTFDYYINTYSNINTPPTYTVFERNGKQVRMIEDNAGLKETMKEKSVLPVEFFDFTTSEDVNLNGWMIKPPNFDENKEYPVFMYQYSGPGSQQVTDSWKSLWWYEMLAQKGFLVACVDGRGTGGRGEEFKKMTYKELGKLETMDQIEAAKYLGSLSYTDKDRIGIYGWSYGGYMSSLAILKGNDVFKAAIAVAPVTNWKWYDTIYTERYMQTEEENESGYRDNSPVYFADKLKGNYLLVHGMGDDNVHFQHTAEMANALIDANKQFDTYFYQNRNHGIYGGYTRLHLFTKMTDFLKENLMEDDSPVGEVQKP